MSKQESRGKQESKEKSENLRKQEFRFSEENLRKEDILRADSTNALYTVLTHLSKKAISDLSEEQIVSLLQAYSYITFIKKPELREELKDLLDSFLLLRISKKREGRKELIKLFREKREILNIFQRKKERIQKEEEEYEI